MLHFFRCLLLLQHIPQELPSRVEIPSAQILQQALQLGILTHLATQSQHALFRHRRHFTG